MADICKRHFQKFLRGRSVLNFDIPSFEFLPKFEMTFWHQTGERALAKPMMGQFTDVQMRHQVLIINLQWKGWSVEKNQKMDGRC